MARYVLEVMYDGTCFHGSQVQGDTPTVQLAVNVALSTLLRAPIASYGASRTDEGVHALQNYYHFDWEDDLRPDFLYKCNAVMSGGVAVRKIFRAVNPDFNVRFDATARSYRYRIYATKNPFLLGKALFYPFPLDMEVLTNTAGVIKEYTNFESFAKRNSQTKTFDCQIVESYWERNGEELHYIVRANRFLRGMVRGLVGTQLKMAKGGRDLGHFRQIIEARDCTKAFFNVAGHGLYLEHIVYNEGSLVLLHSL
jgi:tRNA pseudouridine38-40 synthase